MTTNIQKYGSAIPLAWSVVTNRNTTLIGYDNIPLDRPVYDPCTQVSNNILAMAGKSWCEMNSTGDFLIGKDKDTQQDD